MNLTDGATAEIVSRWPEHQQRNVALEPDTYGRDYRLAMLAGIELVRDRYKQLKSSGVEVWSVDAELAALLDELAATPTTD